MHEEEREEEKVASLDDSTRVRALPLIEGFQVERPLGGGAMGRVFLATQTNLGRKVAIKMMTAELSHDPEFRTRFENEAKVVARFRHKNIVSVHSSGEVEGFKYIVMECAAGGTLAERLESGPLPEPHAIHIARQLADALAYSHARGIIHRDFKPGNILFTEDDVPVLSDFGVARSTARDRTVLTRVGVAVGAPAYMAPEQKLGEDVTERIDIYSFGLVLFQMCIGVLPRESNRVVRTRHHEVQLRAELEDISRPVVDLICRCLQWDPARRPSAEECSQVLESAGRAASLEPRQSRPVPYSRRRRLAVVSSILVLVAGALLFGLFAQRPIPRSEPADTGVAPFTLPSLAEHERFIEAIEAPSLTPAGFRGISDPTLRTTLELRQLRLSGRTDQLQQRARGLETQAANGDARAGLILYLAAESGAIDRNVDDFVPALEAAMTSGYALATFWYAIRLRDMLPAEVRSNDPRLQRYCQTMRLASDQGLTSFAAPYVNDECSRQ